MRNVEKLSSVYLNINEADAKSEDIERQQGAKKDKTHSNKQSTKIISKS